MKKTSTWPPVTHQTDSGSSSGKGRLAAVSSGSLKGNSSSIRNRGKSATRPSAAGATARASGRRPRTAPSGREFGPSHGSASGRSRGDARAGTTSSGGPPAGAALGRAAPGWPAAGRIRPCGSAINWSCVPRWTTRPAERTMISSQSRIVLSRWAMIRQVQPRRRRWSSTIASVFGIQGAGGLVEDQQARIADQRPGDLQPLPLAAREVPGPLGDGRVVTASPLQQVAMDRRAQAGLDQPVAADQLVPESQVVAHRSLEHGDPLIDQRHRVDEELAGNLVDGLAVVEDRAAPGLVEPGDQAGEGRLAAPRAADQGDALAGPDHQREVLDQRLLDRPVVAERHAAELEVARRAGATAAARPRCVWVSMPPGQAGRASSTGSIR